MAYSKEQCDIVYRTPFDYVDRYFHYSEAARLKEQQLAVNHDDGEPFEIPTDITYKLSRTHGKNGFGLKTDETIPAGVPVCVLYGTKMLPIESVGSNFKTVETPSGQIISFEEKAGISYYIKGGCDPNLVLKWIWVNGEEFGIFFSKHEIPAGTELVVDYLHILRHDEKNILCDCGSNKCRVGLAAKLPKQKTFCILCPRMVFRNYKHAHEHRVIDHIYRGRLPCQFKICDRWFKSFGGYEKHLKNGHRNERLNEMTGRENYNKFPCPNMCGFVGDKPKETIDHMSKCNVEPPSVANRGLQPQVDAQRLIEGDSEDESNEEREELCRESVTSSPSIASAIPDHVECGPRRAGKGAFSPISPVLGDDEIVICSSPVKSSCMRPPTPSPQSSGRTSPALSYEGRRTPPVSEGRKSPSPCTPPSPRPLWNNSTSLKESPVSSSRCKTPTSPVCSIASSADTVPIRRNLNQAFQLAGSNSPPQPPTNRNEQNVDVESGEVDMALVHELLAAVNSGDPERLYQANRRLYIAGQIAQGVPENEIVIDEERGRQVSSESLSSQSSTHPFSSTTPPRGRKPLRQQKKPSSKRRRKQPTSTETPSRPRTTAVPRRRLVANDDYIPVPLREILPRRAKQTEKAVPRTRMVTTKSAMRLKRVLDGAEERNLEENRKKRKAVLSPEEESSSTNWTTRRGKRSRKGDGNEDEQGAGMFIPSESSNARYLREATRRGNRKDGDDDGNGLVC